jgi:hypothetical protein
MRPRQGGASTFLTVLSASLLSPMRLPAAIIVALLATPAIAAEKPVVIPEG